LLLTKLSENGVEVNVNQNQNRKTNDQVNKEEVNLRHQTILKKKQINELQLFREYETGLLEGE
jgi:hypothetical protein